MRIAATVVLIVLLGALSWPIASLFWPKAKPSCTLMTAPVLFKSVKSHQSQSIGRVQIPTLDVEYEYSVGGARYTSRRVSCLASVWVSSNEVKWFLSEAPTRTNIVAFFPPTDPTVACLVPGEEYRFSTLETTSPECRAQ
jgi:hypothetical protein